MNVKLADVWHRRLVHQSRKSTKELVKSVLNVDLPIKECSVCSSCQFGKSHRQSIPKKTKSRAIKPLELIHSDVGGPLPVQSHIHATMYVLFIDDATRFTQVYLMKSKSEVTSKFIEFVTAAELKFSEQGLKVKALRCDSGTEYLNKALTAFAASKGIEVQPSPPYTHECNGVCERANRTLMEAVRCLLFDAGLPPSFWAEALLTAVYVRNRCFTSALKKPQTPWSAWSDTPTDLSNLRIFGSLVYVHVESHDRNKLQPTSVPGVFVGYTQDRKSYRVWIHSAKAVHVTRHVTFDESQRGWTWQAGKRDGLSGSVLRSSEATLVSAQDATGCAVSGRVKAVSVCETEALSNDGEALPRRSGRPHVPVQPHWHVHPDRRPDLYAYFTIAQHAQIDPAAELSLTESQRDANLAAISAEPSTLRQAMMRPDWPQWHKALEAELQSLHTAGVWTLVDPPAGCNVVGCKPVFKLKRRADGQIDRYKARYVAQGYSQVQGIDFNETFAPVAKTASIRALLALAAWHGLHVHQMDVDTAFLNGDIDCLIYMQQPPGSVQLGNESKVCLLKKSIYGLKQSGRLWYQKMHDALVRQHGFEAMHGDHCVYRRDDTISGSVIWIALYVDDLLIMSSDLDALSSFKTGLAATFSMKDLGPAQYILGIQIHRDIEAGTLTINQSSYVRALVAKFNMTNSRPISTPMEVKHGLRHSQSPVDRLGRDAMRSTPYLSAVGGIMYAMTCTRPDLAYAVTTLSQFGNNPGAAHWSACKRVLQYMNCTSNVGITYRAKPPSYRSGQLTDDKAELYGFCDADWGSNPDNRRSITGYAWMLAGGVISWAARRQPTVALSTVEAEYMGYCMAAKEAIWWRQLLSQLYYQPTNQSQTNQTQLPSTTIFADNQGAIALAQNPEFHQKTKHISIIYHFVRERVASRDIRLEYLSTHEMAADFLTKSLPRDGLLRCCSRLGIGTAN